ncbi:MAG TPA: DNA-binding protein [Alicycliphilus sp.]|nr:DNA-binding protein [Alicycliphilus sp.]
MQNEGTKTHAQVREELRRKGVPVARWADTHGVDRSVAYGVLAGRLKGSYGEAHRAAVLLGLKDGDVIDYAQ